MFSFQFFYQIRQHSRRELVAIQYTPRDANATQIDSRVMSASEVHV